MESLNEKEKENSNFEENVKEEIPESDYNEIIRSISRVHGKPLSKNALSNKAKQTRNSIKKRRSKNKQAKKSRKRNRRK